MCLDSILKSDFKNFEIIVVDQSDSPLDLSELPNNKNIKYIADKNRGAGIAKNLAIKNAHGSILAFTDDDCIVTKNWLTNINEVFSNNSDISGVFGKVSPYKSFSHENETCPSIVTKSGVNIVNKPCLHWKHLGFGNNMAFRKRDLTKVGFKNWLGPGSIGKNADDAGTMLSMLIKHYKLMYNPKIKVWHNRWLNKTEFEKQKLSYEFGELACYGYFFFQGYKFAKPVLRRNFKNSYYQSRKIIKKIVLLDWKNNLKSDIINTVNETFCQFGGLMVGFFYSIFDQTLKHRN
jgi:glycosyltransferase involved in cell wall biosynthesis